MQFADLLRQPWIGLKCGSDVGEWSDGDNRHFSRTAADTALDDLRRRFVHRLDLGGREFDVAQAVHAVGGGGHKPPPERRSCASRDWNIGAACNFDHPQRIRHREIHGGISRHSRNRLNLQFRRAHGKEQGQCVIDPRIRVNDHLARRRFWPWKIRVMRLHRCATSRRKAAQGHASDRGSEKSPPAERAQHEP